MLIDYLNKKNTENIMMKPIEKEFLKEEERFKELAERARKQKGEKNIDLTNNKKEEYTQDAEDFSSFFKTLENTATLKLNSQSDDFLEGFMSAGDDLDLKNGEKTRAVNSVDKKSNATKKSDWLIVEEIFANPAIRNGTASRFFGAVSVKPLQNSFGKDDFLEAFLGKVDMEGEQPKESQEEKKISGKSVLSREEFLEKLAESKRIYESRNQHLDNPEQMNDTYMIGDVPTFTYTPGFEYNPQANPDIKDYSMWNIWGVLPNVYKLIKPDMKLPVELYKHYRGGSAKQNG